MKQFIFILAFSGMLKLTAQVEYLVQVDPVTGALGIVDSIPGVKFIQTGPSFTTVDNVNNIYYFRGIDNVNAMYMYGIDGATGQVLTKATFPSTVGVFSNFGSMEHDDSTGTLFCIALKASENRLYFVKFDKITGQITPVSVVYGAKAVAFSESTYDQKNHHYYFKGVDSLNKIRLYQISSSNGVITASSILPSSAAIVKYKFNSVTGKLYAFSSSIPSTNQGVSLVEINPVTGAIQNTVTTYSALPGVVIFPNYHTISTVNNRQTFRFNSNLATVDLTAGTIIHNPVFPTGTTTGTNVIELRYNGNTGVLFGLHWGDIPNTTGLASKTRSNNRFSLDVFPNPIVDRARIKINTGGRITGLYLLSEQGMLLRSEILTDKQSYLFERGDLAAGLYFLEAEDGTGNRIRRKLIIQ